MKTCLRHQSLVVWPPGGTEQLFSILSSLQKQEPVMCTVHVYSADSPDDQLGQVQLGLPLHLPRDGVHLAHHRLPPRSLNNTFWLLWAKDKAAFEPLMILIDYIEL